jgi:hypothetical protein
VAGSLLVTRVARCIKRGRTREFVFKKTVGQALSIHGGGIVGASNGAGSCIRVCMAAVWRSRVVSTSCQSCQGEPRKVAPPESPGVEGI